jgi:formylglycine-generating enzyme required for sulfatase activity
MKTIIIVFLLLYPITGNTADYHPADTNKDWQISLEEFNAYNTAWRQGNEWPDSVNPIPNTYVARGGYLYKKGKCYHEKTGNAPMNWDSDRDCDRTVDVADGCPDDPNKVESGICDCGQSDDSDRDNDNTPDCIDGCPDDPNKGESGICGCGQNDDSDRDNDNTPDCIDGCPDDPNKIESGYFGCGEPEDFTITNTIGMKFVFIKPGTFMMGSPTDEPGRGSNETQHQVTLTKGYYMQTTEVTQGQWKAIMNKNPSNFSSCGNNCPVEEVSWNEVQGFITVLNQKEKTDVYRLPTEAEWEYAVRAGTSTPFAFGNCLSTNDANYEGDYPLTGCSKGIYRKKTIAVGSLKANAWGLYDMHGNVWEWCQDWYGSYPTNSLTDPGGPSSGSNRVLRGGNWRFYAQHCRSAARNSFSPGTRGSTIGLRLSRTLKP